MAYRTMGFCKAACGEEAACCVFLFFLPRAPSRKMAQVRCYRHILISSFYTFVTTVFSIQRGKRNTSGGPFHMFDLLPGQLQFHTKVQLPYAIH
jgi:hypothetical protein